VIVTPPGVVPPIDDLRDYEPIPSPAGRRRWIIVVVASLLALLLLTGGIAAWWVQRQIDPPGNPGRTVAVTVYSGASVRDIGNLLEKAGVVSSALVFDWYVRLKKSGSFQAGDYTFHTNESMGNAVKVLKAGPSQRSRKITFPEGLTIGEVVKLGAANLPNSTLGDWYSAAISGLIRSRYEPADVMSLEGLLFPDTYQLGDTDTASNVMQRMVTQLDEVCRGLSIESGSQKLGLTPYQVIIVASMIEREAKVAADRPKIARVIYNRLALRMNLEIDASVIYGLGGGVTKLTSADLAKDTPYNLYLHGGLPPTPIGMPGRASIQAALNPDAGSWFYYVLADKDGRHAFASTLAEHEANVAKARAAGLLG
jgi:UPF0755 protein